MSRSPSARAYREAREDPLWGTVWRIWPDALTYEADTPFDGRQHNRKRPAWRLYTPRPRKHQV